MISHPVIFGLPIIVGICCAAADAAERGKRAERAAPAAESASPEETGFVRGILVDGKSGETLPGRVYVTSPDGRVWFDRKGIVFERDEEQHFLTAGAFEVRVPTGKITLRAERGPEWKPTVKTVDVPADGEIEVKLPMERWIDMAAQGWFSADLHMHRAPEEFPLAMLAEDLNYTPLIATHLHTNTCANIWDGKEAPKDFLVRVDDTHAYTVMDEELERLGRRTYGASIFIGMKRPIPRPPGLLYPPDSWYIEQARAQGALIDAEKPFWRATPENVALGLIDTMGVVCNHLHRQEMMPEAEPYGAIPRPAQYDPKSGRDFVHWVMEMYYRYLNCGFRLPVTGGTASGIMPSPVGYNRVYAKLEGAFSFENYIAALKSGRTFATNGPMMRFTVDGKDSGAEIRLEPGKDATVRLKVEASSATPLEFLEIVRNGEVVARKDGNGKKRRLSLDEEIAMPRSGWIAARTFEVCPITERCAQTSPVYILLGDQPIASRADAEYFIGVMDQLIADAESAQEFQSDKERQETLAVHRKARGVYERIAAQDRTGR